MQLNRLNWRDYLNYPDPVACALMAKMQIAHEYRTQVRQLPLSQLEQLSEDFLDFTAPTDRKNGIQAPSF